MAKRTRRPTIEYRLTIARHMNERINVPTVLFTIETTKLFANFRYELSVQEVLHEKTLRFTIVGLKAPRLDMPASGPAGFVREYDNLKGKMEISVVSLDGSENLFTINFTKNITLLKSPQDPFIELVFA